MADPTDWQVHKVAYVQEHPEEDLPFVLEDGNREVLAEECGMDFNEF